MPASDPRPPVTSDPTVPLEGDAPAALDQLFPLVYDELRRLAHRELRGEPTGHSLGTTALVHEVYLRLASQRDMPFTDRHRFLALAAHVMRHVLVDCARRFRAARHGGGQVPLALDEASAAAEARADEMLALDEALSRLGLLEPRLAQVVECRFFAGLSEEETAEVLGVTSRTVRRDWARAKGWLYAALGS